MEKECCRCGNFTAYYIKAYCCYVKENCGMCAIKNQLTGKHDSCESWRAKKVNTKIKHGIIMGSLADAITNISIIKEFLEENS
ncbi:MAG: hypothetical protein K2N33_05625 [Clostridia bacterium]|nr:hypothetical protein [Clostridia bacterium]